MSAIIGAKIHTPTKHPQDVIDLFYEEIFDHYDAEDEIDVAVVFSVEQTGPESGICTIVDFQVMRVGSEFVPDESITDPIERLKYADAWARSVEGGDQWWFFHKHAEGGVFISDKDEITNDVLTNIDYIRSEMDENGNMHHFYGLMPVLNRNASLALRAGDSPIPTGNVDLDLELIEKMVQRTKARFHLSEDHPLVATMEELSELIRATFEARERGDMSAMLANLPRTIELLDIMISETDRMMAEKQPSFEDVMEALRSDDPLAAMQALTGQRSGMVKLDVPTRNNDEEEGEFPILGRPQIQAPAEPIAAEPFPVAKDPIEFDEPDRPEVPDAFKDLDINWES